MKRNLELMSMTAEKRYKILIEEYPNIFDTFTSVILASYLNITAQTLSKIRSLNLD